MSDKNNCIKSLFSPSLGSVWLEKSAEQRSKLTETFLWLVTDLEGNVIEVWHCKTMTSDRVFVNQYTEIKSLS